MVSALSSLRRVNSVEPQTSQTPFFFSSRRRHTCWTGDWSSDVCSSDLSVTGADIAEFLKGKGFDIDRRKLILPEPIKTIGDHNVPLKLHREVTVPLVVHVVKEGGSPAPRSEERRVGKECRARWSWEQCE